MHVGKYVHVNIDINRIRVFSFPAAGVSVGCEPSDVRYEQNSTALYEEYTILNIESHLWF